MRDDAEGGGEEEEEEAGGRCKLLASNYGYALQAVLALAALLSLLCKRQTESPRRPFLVWTMDVSKQGFGSVIIHFWNIALAVLFTELSTNVDDADECAFYFITFVIDTVLGVVLVWLLLKVQREVALFLRIQSLQEHGYYGDPPSFGVYFAQMLAFLLIIVIVKVALAALVFVLRSPIESVGTALFSSIRGAPNAELTLVMVIGPCFLNIVQYWVQDNLLMDKTRSQSDYGNPEDESDKEAMLPSAVEMTSVER